jgi:hypothetical protein
VGRIAVAGVAVLGGVGLVLVVWRVTPRTGKPEAESPAAAARGRTRRVPARPPAARDLRPTIDSEWDGLTRSDRTDRAERAVEQALADPTDADADADPRAWLLLSASRADFFATDAGAQRYVELVEALSRRAAHDANDE